MSRANTPTNHYEALGIEKTASVSDIKQAFRRLAMVYHPDKNGGDDFTAELFKSVNLAYETLKDPVLRKKYDALIAQQSYKDPTYKDLADKHAASSVKNTRPSKPTPRRGENIRSGMNITLDDLLRPPSIKEFRYSRQEKCPTCHGSGHEPSKSATPVACEACNATGFIEGKNGSFKFRQPCHSCNSTGFVFPEDACQICLGSGRVIKQRRIEVTIAAGTTGSTVLRVAHGGHAGVWGGEYGDLLLDLKLETPKEVQVVGDDIHLKLHLDPLSMLIGTEIKISGQIDPIKIPANTKANERIILKSRGLTKKDGSKGAIILEVEMEWPSSLNPKQLKAISEAKKLLDSDLNTPAAHYSVKILNSLTRTK